MWCVQNNCDSLKSGSMIRLRDILPVLLMTRSLLVFGWLDLVVSSRDTNSWSSQSHLIATLNSWTKARSYLEEDWKMLNACRRTLPVELFFAKTPASLYLPCLAPSLNLILLTYTSSTSHAFHLKTPILLNDSSRRTWIDIALMRSRNHVLPLRILMHTDCRTDHGD